MVRLALSTLVVLLGSDAVGLFLAAFCSIRTVRDAAEAATPLHASMSVPGEPAFAVFIISACVVGFLLWIVPSILLSTRTSHSLTDILWVRSACFLPLAPLYVYYVALGISSVPVTFSQFLFVCLCSISGGLHFALWPVGEKRWVAGRWPLAALSIAAALFAALFSWLPIRQYRALNLGYSDCGIFAEALWNTLHGRFLHTNTFPFGNLLGNHFYAILLPLVPLYAIWPCQEMLAIIQSVAIASAAFPIFMLARRRFGSDLVALCFGLAYLLYPPAQFQNSSFTYGFHAVSLAIPLLLWTIYFAEKRSLVGLIVFGLLALCCKETVAVVIFTLGLYHCVVTRRWRIGLAVAAAGIGWFLVTTQLVIPRVADEPYLFTGYYYGEKGNSIPQVAGYLLTHPLATLQEIATMDKIAFVLQLLVPLCLLSLAGLEALLIGLPTLLFLLLGNQSAFWHITYHYKATLIPPVFFAAIVGGHRLVERLDRAMPALLSSVPLRAEKAGHRMLMGLLLTSSLLVCWFFGETPLSMPFNPLLCRPTRRYDTVQKLKKLIPREATVAATERIAAHLTDRATLRRLSQDWAQPEYVVIDLNEVWPSPASVHKHYRAVRRRREYGVWLFENGIVVFKKGQRPL